MKSPEEQKESLAKLNEVDLIELRALVEEITNLKDKNISIENLTQIGNTCRSLEAFREKYMYRVINLLKGGWLS